MGQLQNSLHKRYILRHTFANAIPAKPSSFGKLDRLASSTRDLLNTMETLNETGAKFQSISEPWANTTTQAGKMIMTVFAGISEFERDLIRERTGAGRETAQRRGVQFGRPRKLNPDQCRLASELLGQGNSVRDVARGRSTFTKRQFIG